jgi:hypothetical protein
VKFPLFLDCRRNYAIYLAGLIFVLAILTVATQLSVDTARVLLTVILIAHSVVGARGAR